MKRDEFSAVALSLGSNVGDSETTLKDCLLELSDVLVDMKVSNFYRTQPVNMRYQPDFINAAVCGRTRLSPHGLLKRVNFIEKKFGRVREIKFGPRTLDIDIIFFGDMIIETNSLKIPHPELGKRLFVLIPLAEIAPDVRCPKRNKKVGEILDDARRNLKDIVEKI